MMQQGIASLAPQQAPQGMAPGQAAPQSVLPQQQGQTPQAVTGTLEKLPPQQLLAMYNNPQDMTPKWAVATAYAKAIEQARLMQAASGQGAMAQSAMQAQQPPVVQQIMSQPIPAAQGGIMQGYAGGGAVAFAPGGAVTQEESDRQKILAALSGAGMSVAKLAAAGIDVATIPVRTLASIYNTVTRAPRAFGVPVPALPKEATLENLTPAMDVIRRMEAGPPPTPPTELPASEVASEIERLKGRPTGIAAALTPASGAPRPDAGRPAASSAAPAPAPTPAPKPDEWAGILSRGREGIAALQDVDRKQGEVDPELARLRGAAYESAQGIAQRRERDRLAALEAAQKAASAPLMDNQEALLRLAGSIGGRMRLGEALGAMAGAAGGIRGEQRKALEAAQRESRLEQNAIDQLNQALAEKRVADRSGDVERRRAADRRVAEAQLKVTDLEMGVQRTREGFDIERAKLAAEREKTQAAREATGIARDSAIQERYSRQYNTILANMQAQETRIRKDHEEKYKMLDLEVRGYQGKALPPELQKQLNAANKDLADKLGKIEKMYAPQLQKLSQQIGIGNVIPWDSIK